ncbi:MAG TPA: hypothetical protein VGI17_01010 [Solirubrobacterales bacterium]|jgi:magnesium-transporting ATPase (P-type)
MAATPAIGERGGSLGRWIVAPIVGAVVLVVVAFQMHEAGCGASLTDQAAGVVFSVLSAMAVLATLGLGAWRLAAMLRSGRGAWRKVPAIGTAAVVVLAVAGVKAPLGWRSTSSSSLSWRGP